MHVGLQLDNKLSFNEYIHTEMSKATKGVGLLPKLQTILARRTSSTVYKSFIRPDLDHGDVSYDQPFKAPFSSKIESVLYHAAVAVTGANKGSSRDKLCQDVSFEYLCHRIWMRRLYLLYKVFSTKKPSHTLNLRPQIRHYPRHPNTVNSFPFTSETLQKYLFSKCH